MRRQIHVMLFLVFTSKKFCLHGQETQKLVKGEVAVLKDNIRSFLAYYSTFKIGGFICVTYL